MSNPYSGELESGLIPEVTTASKFAGEFIKTPTTTNHNDLLQLQGGSIYERYHLTQLQHDDLPYKSSANIWTAQNTFTVGPIIPTAAVDTNTTQAASTAYVIAQGYAKLSDLNSIYARLDGATFTGSVIFSGSVTVPNSTITYAKIQNISATDKILGRSSAGAGVIQEITCTAAGRALLDDVSVVAQKTTLGLENVTNESKATMFTSPALTGSPTAPTQTADDDSTKIATTAYVDAAANATKYKLGLYQDFPNFNMTVIRNPQMDNSLNTYGKKIFKVITSGAFTSDMIGVRFVCTNAGSSTRDFRAGATVILRTAGGVDVAADTPLVLNTVYTVVSANEPDTWGGTELTPYDGIVADKWYMVRDNSITYNGSALAASTYDAFGADWANGENLSPVVFKGVAGVTTYTGNGFAYELNYLVVESSTGNGGIAGTITLNWLPDIYSLYNPVEGREWALHRVAYDGVTVDKTLKITGGDYIRNILNFEVSGDSGYTPFSNTDFAQGKMVALYNPFATSFDIDWATTFIPSNPDYGDRYILGSGLFKRKTDGEYCGIMYGISSLDERQRLGYLITPDFLSDATTMSPKPFLDGKLTDTYQSTGNLAVNSKYKIITTESNHFGAGLVAGDFFKASAATACDANNTVRVVGDTWHWIGQVSAPMYIGQADDGLYLWECFSAFTNAALNDTQIAVIRFDETFTDKHLKIIDIDIPTLTGDAYELGVKYLQYPNYVYYDGKHRLIVTALTDSIITHPWKTYEYISDGGKYGRYSTRTLIHDRAVSSLTSDTHPTGRDIELFKPFVYNAKLWALVMGTAESSYCGFDANKREISLFRYVDKDGTWVLDGRSPIIINPIYATGDLWGSEYEWAQQHLSTIAPMIEGGIMRYMISAEESTDTYQTTYGTLDLTLLSGT